MSVFQPSMLSARAQPLDLAGPLPSGTVVLEASAGTGKTYAIAALATRAVAEGRCTLPELLLVTFTRAATAELRERVRRRLTGAEAFLRESLDGQPVHPHDDVVHAVLADADTKERRRRHRRLVRALHDFDAATISTIHGFTQQVLRSVGLAVDAPHDPALIEDERPLIEEVADDVYLQRYLGRADVPTRPSRTDVLALAKLVAAHPDAELTPAVADTAAGLVPVDDTLDPTDERVANALERVACAQQLRTALFERKRDRGVLSYDDLLHALRGALTDPAHGAEARAALRRRYRWALIDEFQDTDPVQWDILRDGFQDDTDPSRALVLIGDPKQAIYSFRGADVRAYLTATTDADTRYELATNHRSSPPLIGAVDRMLAGVQFGEAAIRFRPVTAAERNTGQRVSDASDPASLQLRLLEIRGKTPGMDVLRRRVARDVAATLLDQLGRVRLDSSSDVLRPQDVAVLVRTNDDARLMQATLREVGIPSVVNGVGSVLATTATDDWRWLLDALERPSDQARIRRLALSAWIGWCADDLTEDNEGALDQLHDDAARWATVLAEHGVAALERAVSTERRLAVRLLAQIGGERQLTDLRHIGRLLHVAEREEDRGVSGLRSWLLASADEARDLATPPDEQARRLESDARAVQIVTVHRSKGLQYPMVCVPFAWTGDQVVKFPVAVHDDGAKTLDVGPSDRPGADVTKAIAQREQVGEQLRLLYVAVTRAKHRAVIWWSDSKGSAKSALSRVLFRDDDGRVPLDEQATIPEDVVKVLSERFVATSTSVAEVADADPLEGARSFIDTPGDPGALQAASFERDLDRSWLRTSYTGLVRRAELLDQASAGSVPVTVPAVASEPDDEVTDDEPVDDGPVDDPARLLPDTDADTDADADADADADTASRAESAAVGGDPALELPLGPLAGGPTFGTFVHAVLEHTAFDAPDLKTTVAEVVTEQLRWHRVPTLGDDEIPRLIDGLVTALGTPLGPLTGDGDRPSLCLADIGRADRLDELDFEIPLAGGDAATGTVTLAALADLLDRPAAHGGLAPDDPIRRIGYADRLRAPGFRLDVRGYLNGSIDLVLRVTDRGGEPRYLVADHKTNRLGAPTPKLVDYAPDQLADAMVHGDYPLQALLYQVALHRYLRWRQPGYDPQQHLGGVLYLFLRGMAGPDAVTSDGRPYGVFAWRPPAKLVADLSDLLDGVMVASATDPAPEPAATSPTSAADGGPAAVQETLW